MSFWLQSVWLHVSQTDCLEVCTLFGLGTAFEMVSNLLQEMFWGFWSIFAPKQSQLEQITSISLQSHQSARNVQPQPDSVPKAGWFTEVSLASKSFSFFGGDTSCQKFLRKKKCSWIFLFPAVMYSLFSHQECLVNADFLTLLSIAFRFMWLSAAKLPRGAAHNSCQTRRQTAPPTPLFPLTVNQDHRPWNELHANCCQTLCSPPP